MKKITFNIVLFFLCTVSMLKAQERIASFNWLQAGIITFSDSENTSNQFLTDKNDTTFYVVTDNTAETWVQLELEAPVVLSSYTFVSSYNATYDPKQWTLEYSNNGRDWTAVHTKTTSFSARNFPLNISTGLPTDGTGYKFYRITFNNETQAWSLAEMQFFGCKGTFDVNITGNGGILTGQFQGLPAYGETLDKVADNTYKKFCQTGTKSFWLEYESPEPVLLEKYTLTTAYSSDRMPRTWELLGSNDGETYYLLDRRTNKNLFSAPYATFDFAIDSLDAEPVDWGRCADLTYQTLLNEYWRNWPGGGKYFIHANGETPNMGYNYWWNAHALDIFVDAYQRTGKIGYKARMEELHQSILAANRNSYWNTFYDDMEWMGLSCLRAYEALGMDRYKTLSLQLWDWIIAGWSDVNNGGIAWASGSPNSKNACSNAPAMILAARLYNLTGNETYLTWAKRIYLWMDQFMVEPGSGYVWDGYNNHNVANVYTYNMGTWIGGCYELYLITGEDKYLEKAIKSANAVVDNRSKFSPYGILYNGENGGDGGLFKCIFLRYLSQMILRGGLDEDLKNHYIAYMRDNGTALWNAGTMKPEMVVSKKFYERPDSKVQDASIQLCGVMIFELLDELKRAGLMPGKDATITQNAKQAYKYFRLNMLANNGAPDSELGEWQLFGETVKTGIKETVALASPVQLLSTEKAITLIPQDKGQAYSYQLFDISGRIHSKGSASGDQAIRLSAPGIYIVRVRINDQTYSRKVFVK